MIEKFTIENHRIVYLVSKKPGTFSKIIESDNILINSSILASKNAMDSLLMLMNILQLYVLMLFYFDKLDSAFFGICKFSKGITTMKIQHTTKITG